MEERLDEGGKCKREFRRSEIIATDLRAEKHQMQYLGLVILRVLLSFAVVVCHCLVLLLFSH